MKSNYSNQYLAYIERVPSSGQGRTVLAWVIQVILILSELKRYAGLAPAHI